MVHISSSNEPDRCRSVFHEKFLIIRACFLLLLCRSRKSNQYFFASSIRPRTANGTSKLLVSLKFRSWMLLLTRWLIKTHTKFQSDMDIEY